MRAKDLDPDPREGLHPAQDRHLAVAAAQRDLDDVHRLAGRVPSPAPLVAAAHEHDAIARHAERANLLPHTSVELQIRDHGAADVVRLAHQRPSKASTIRPAFVDQVCATVGGRARLGAEAITERSVTGEQQERVGELGRIAGSDEERRAVVLDDVLDLAEAACDDGAPGRHVLVELRRGTEELDAVRELDVWRDEHVARVEVARHLIGGHAAGEGGAVAQPGVGQHVLRPRPFLSLADEQEAGLRGETRETEMNASIRTRVPWNSRNVPTNPIR